MVNQLVQQRAAYGCGLQDHLCAEYRCLHLHYAALLVSATKLRYLLIIYYSTLNKGV